VNEIFKRNNVDRMAKEEFILELLISVFTEEVHDGKTILDKILSDRTSRLSQTKKKEFINTLVWINQIFTIADIKSTRLKNKSDFYSLFFVLSEFYRNGIVTNDSITNKMIHGLILSFLNSVDMYNSHKKTKANDWIKSYSDTVTKGTDQKQQRLIRNDIIRQLLINLPHKTRDKNRTFSELQKHILWHNFRNNPKCSGKKCGGKTLTWDDVTIDHVKAWIKGGCTSLDNAQILCRECNSSKKDK
jgi:5-methylcytosine-specific restriction endonuclease McrA